MSNSTLTVPKSARFRDREGDEKKSEKIAEARGRCAPMTEFDVMKIPNVGADTNTATNALAAAEDRFIPYVEIESVIGRRYSRVHLDRMVQRGQFPPAYRLSPNRVGWKRSDLIAWRNSRPVTVRPNAK